MDEFPPVQTLDDYLEEIAKECEDSSSSTKDIGWWWNATEHLLDLHDEMKDSRSFWMTKAQQLAEDWAASATKLMADLAHEKALVVHKDQNLVAAVKQMGEFQTRAFIAEAKVRYARKVLASIPGYEEHVKALDEHQ